MLPFIRTTDTLETQILTYHAQIFLLGGFYRYSLSNKVDVSKRWRYSMQPAQLRKNTSPALSTLRGAWVMDFVRHLKQYRYQNLAAETGA